jgi:hypothetical protein
MPDLPAAPIATFPATSPTVSPAKIVCPVRSTAGLILKLDIGCSEMHTVFGLMDGQPLDTKITERLEYSGYQ